MKAIWDTKSKKPDNKMRRRLSIPHSSALLCGELAVGEHFLPSRCSLGPPKDSEGGFNQLEGFFCG